MTNAVDAMKDQNDTGGMERDSIDSAIPILETEDLCTNGEGINCMGSNDALNVPVGLMDMTELSSMGELPAGVGAAVVRGTNNSEFEITSIVYDSVWNQSIEVLHRQARSGKQFSVLLGRNFCQEMNYMGEVFMRVEMENWHWTRA